MTFTPPAHLFSDPIALSEFPEENYSGEMEAVTVTILPNLYATSVKRLLTWSYNRCWMQKAH